MIIDRLKYPYPQKVREGVTLLDGVWDFAFEDRTFDKSIVVPFCYQSESSGIGIKDYHGKIYYRHYFDIPVLDEKRTLLCFKAVDYKAEVYINGLYQGSHIGGFTAFNFDISSALVEGRNELLIECEDSLSTSQVRGKQSWRDENFGCWYTATSGIWQSVYLEKAGNIYVEECLITPMVYDNSVKLDVELHQKISATVKAELYLKDKKIGCLDINCSDGEGCGVFSFDDKDILRSEYEWTTDHPNLIDVKLLVDDDITYYYFGMRSITVDKNFVYLNGHMLYQRLVLDQGYWPSSLMTPPSLEALVDDIKLAIQMGFNGARKHQKIEDMRYYFLADLMGFLVWAELPSRYRYSKHSSCTLVNELDEAVHQVYNCPSVIAYVPLNESWGVSNIQKNKEQIAFSYALTYYLKSQDPTRLVSSNDGWETPVCSDFLGIHDYSVLPAWLGDSVVMAKEGIADSRHLYVENEGYHGEPLIFTEFGGIAFADGDESTWGYNGKVNNKEEYIFRLKQLVQAVKNDKFLSGFCYTQLTDVQQETNGLLTAHRIPKISVEDFSEVFGGK